MLEFLMSGKETRPSAHSMLLANSFLQTVLAEQTALEAGFESVAEIFRQRGEQLGEELSDIGLDPQKYLQEMADHLSNYLKEPPTSQDRSSNGRNNTDSSDEAAEELHRAFSKGEITEDEFWDKVDSTKNSPDLYRGIFLNRLLELSVNPQKE